MMKFTDRKVIVTGGTRGIGKAVASGFAAAGAQVILTGRDATTAQAVAAELDGDVQGLELDVANVESVQKFFAEALERLGGLDILVANAGITRDKLVMPSKMKTGTMCWAPICVEHSFACERRSVR